MFWVPLVSLLLVACCSDSDAQLTVSQPTSDSVSLGKTVKLSCSVSSSDRRIYWYQQKPGNAPRFLLHYYSESNKGQGSGVPARYSGSKDASGNIGYLTISGVLAEDEAVYYCAAWSPSNVWVFGGGTHMTVTGQPAAPPSVSLFPPSQEELKSKNKATLACLMDGFHPGVVQVEWLGDGRTISSGVETTKPVKQGDKYIASSYLTLSRSEWEANESYTCKVTHESKTIEKVVSRSACS
ncbi:immunoglobulin lambda-1 light chain-like isoform X2 [Anolis sagrei]|uniref:immunoglobulin lambda-1 light chain-like isoform X2 n=1 Tax=Anolis sagrei TaxID=38937 RepID=UPI003520B65C